MVAMTDQTWARMMVDAWVCAMVALMAHLKAGWMVDSKESKWVVD